MAITFLRSRRGFTLIEMMISVAIISILALVATRLLAHGSQFFRSNMSRGELERDSRAALESVIKGLPQAQADSVVISRLATVPPQPPFSQLSFSTAAPVRNFRFWQDGHKLMMEVDGRSRVLCTDLHRFLAVQSDTATGSTVSISIVLDRQYGKDPPIVQQISAENIRLLN